MSRLFKAIANRSVFANRKDRVIANKAKTSESTTLHAHLAHAAYWLCGSCAVIVCRPNGHGMANQYVHAAIALVDVGYAAVRRGNGGAHRSS